MKRVIIAAALGVFAVALPVQADFTVATVDINKVLNESKGAKAKRDALDEMSRKAQKQVEAKRDALKSTEEKLKSRKVAEDSKEAEAFRNDARQFARFVKDTEEDLKREFLKVNRDLTERAVGAVKSYAEAKKIDLVLDKSEQGRGPVLFGAGTADITDAVIKEMNR